MKLDIATINKRNHTKWKNRSVLWEKLVNLLSNTARTPESYKEYLAMTKGMQADIKDVGGFVGGYLNGGRRGVGTVRHRQLVTLDIDDCPLNTADLIFDVCFALPYEMVIHSSHKHSDEKPRLRLILPLDRPVSPDEYEAIARRLAGNVNIEHFDPTTFQPSRFMYWPSTSADAEYVFEHQQGPVCVADEILAEYVEWKDISAWPRISAEEPRLAGEVRTMEDPTSKDGVVGAFCRAFDVNDVLEKYLMNVYEQEDNGRYTYLDGSSAGGGVVYQKGMFFYSHHGTDPAGGMLSNSFDLVRLHKFGGLDTGKEVAMTKRESFKAMCDFAIKIPEVKAEMQNVDKPLSKALFHDFADIDDDGESTEAENFEDILGERTDIEVLNTMGKPDLYLPAFKSDFGDGLNEDNWQDFLEYTKSKGGELSGKIGNFKLVIVFDPELKGKIALNDFEKEIYVTGSLPWNRSKEFRRWEDADEAGMAEYVETKWGLYNMGKFSQALILASVINRFHPIQHYLKTLTWDGKERLDTMLIDYLGADDTPYVRAVTRKAFTAAVARVMKPGCKMDYVLTLVGKEGLKKSSLLAEMGGAWFSDSFTTVDGTKAFEQIQGGWIIEIAELSAFNRVETNAIKAFVTKRWDRFRGAYKRNTENNPRQCVFFATTNDTEFLKGDTGNRRFWPVYVRSRYERPRFVEKNANGSTPVVGLPVDQLWAEAVERYRQGETLFLDNELEIEAAVQQETFRDSDDRLGMVEQYLEMPVPHDWDSMGLFERREYINKRDYDPLGEIRDKICAFEIWEECLGLDKKDCHNYRVKEIRGLVSRVKGWEYSDQRVLFKPYGYQRHFERVGEREVVS